MARIEGVNDVFDPRSGEAVILGNNNAIGQYVANNERKKQRAEAERAALAKAQQDRNIRIEESIAKLSPGVYSQRFGQPVSQAYNNTMAKAKQLQQQGINPMTDPDFREEWQGVINMAAASKELETQYNDVFNTVGDNPDAYFNGTEVIQAYQDPDALNKYVNGEFRPGTLQKRYNVTDIIKLRGDKPSQLETNDGSKAVNQGNHQEHVRRAVTSLEMPEVQQLIKQRGGDANSPYMFGFPIEEEGQLPRWETDKKNLEMMAIDQLENDPEFIRFLEEKGMDVSTAEKSIDSAVDYMAKQNRAVGGYVNGYANELTGRAKTSMKVDFSAARERRAREAAARSRESHDLSKRSSELTIAKKIKDLSDGNDGKAFGDVLVSGLQGGNKEAFEDFQRAYGSKGEVTLGDGYIEIEVGDGKQRINLNETERIRQVVREAFPSTQYKAKVNSDAYQASDGKFNAGGANPNLMHLTPEQQTDYYINKYGGK